MASRSNSWHPPCLSTRRDANMALPGTSFAGPSFSQSREFARRKKRSSPKMNRTSLTIFLALSTALSVGCASKNYVRQQTTPLINKTNELDDLTAKNSKDIKDVDARAQAGIDAVNAKTAQVEQKTRAAAQQAAQAQTLADSGVSRVDTLQNTVANLDNYHVVTEAAVHFGFNKDNLTKKAKDALDQLATDVGNTKGYIIAVEGSADYNYTLSQRRADAVIQYLASQHNIPAHKIYLIGLGKDKPAESNKTSGGRAANRRVDVRLMSNTTDTAAPASQPTAATQPAPPSM